MLVKETKAFEKVLGKCDKQMHLFSQWRTIKKAFAMCDHLLVGLSKTHTFHIHRHVNAFLSDNDLQTDNKCIKSTQLDPDKTHSAVHL